MSDNDNSFYSVSVEFDSPMEGAASYEVQTVRLQAVTQVKERLVFVQTAATGGTLNFMLERTSNGTITYFKNATIPHSATVPQFLGMLNSFDIYAPYSPSVTLVVKDNAGAVVAPGAGTAYTYTWTVEFGKSRPA